MGRGSCKSFHPQPQAQCGKDAGARGHLGTGETESPITALAHVFPEPMNGSLPRRKLARAHQLRLEKRSPERFVAPQFASMLLTSPTCDRMATERQ